LEFRIAGYVVRGSGVDRHPSGRGDYIMDIDQVAVMGKRPSAGAGWK
jgi:hypothetical protein